MLDRVFLIVGLALMLVGAILAAVSEVNVESTTRTIPITVYEFKRLLPGTYTDKIVIESGSLNGLITEESPEHSSSTMIREPPEYCNGTERVLDFGLEGAVENRHGTLYLEILAYRRDGSVMVVANYTIPIEKLEPAGPTITTTSQGIVMVVPTATAYTFTASGEGILTPSLYGIAYSEDLMEMNAPPMRVELPVDVVRISVNLRSDIAKELHYGLSVLDICNYTYTLEEPHIKPYGRIEYLKIPYIYGVDLNSLKLSLVFVILGNMLALIGIYLRMGSLTGK